MNDRSVDLLIVGGGVVGLAVAWAASANNDLTIGVLERSTIGNARGSSAGDARLRVLAGYPEDSYLLRGLTAHEEWKNIEAVSGQQVLQQTGSLSWGDGQEGIADSLDSHNVPFEMWDFKQVRRDYPQVSLPEGTVAIHQADSGIIHAPAALDALTRAITSRAVAVHERVQVQDIHPGEILVKVDTDQGQWTAGQVAVCAGPWSQELLSRLGIPLAVTMTRQTVCYYEFTGPQPVPGIIEYGRPDPYCLFSPRYGVKSALHEPGPVADVAGDTAADPAAVDRTSAWTRSRFGDLVGIVPVAVDTCVYTSTADERFVVERYGQLLVVSACSGHGFQYAPETGQQAAMQLR